MKKDYLAPATEIVDVEIEAELLAGTVNDDSFNGGAIDTGGGWADDDE